MGTCYRIIDHKNKRYYDMDKWSVHDSDLTSKTTLHQRLVLDLQEEGEEEWRIEMGKAIVRDVARHMEFPLTYGTDTSDGFMEVEEAGYMYVGDRFCSYHGVSTPYDPKPIVPGIYAVWDDDPFTASKPKPYAQFWDGNYWCDLNRKRLVVEPRLWWCNVTHPVVVERGTK